MTSAYGIDKATHDAHVARTGRPYTQGPIDRHLPHTVPVGLHEIPAPPKPKPKRRRPPVPACTLAVDCPAARHEKDCASDG